MIPWLVWWLEKIRSQWICLLQLKFISQFKWREKYLLSEWIVLWQLNLVSSLIGIQKKDEINGRICRLLSVVFSSCYWSTGQKSNGNDYFYGIEGKKYLRLRNLECRGFGLLRKSIRSTLKISWYQWSYFSVGLNFKFYDDIKVSERK